MLRLLAATRGSRIRRDTRGTTMVEYAIMLFLVLCVAGLCFKVLGVTLAKKVGSTNKHMEGQGESAPAGQSGQSAANSTAGGGAKAVGPSADGINKDPSATGSRGGDGESKSGDGSMMVRFALIALGVVGAAAAFFAIAKGKPAG